MQTTSEDDEYQRWIERFDTLTDEDRRWIGRHGESGELPPLLVLVPVDPANRSNAEAACERLRAQLFRRFRAVPCEANKVIEPPAPAECVVVLSAEVILRDHALYGFAAAAARAPEARLIYSDSDRLDANGKRIDPWFKPGLSPELLRRTAYLGGCGLVRTDDVGGVIERLLAAADVADFLSREASALPRAAVARVPMVLYHIYHLSRPAGEVGASAPGEGRWSTHPHPPRYARRPLPHAGEVKISIIIPTRDHVGLLRDCLHSIRDITDYPATDLDIIVVDNGSAAPKTLEFLTEASSAGSISVLRDPGPFNFARLNNLAAREAAGDVLVFINNDTIVNRADWLRRLTHFAMQEDVGVVGAKLLHADRSVQHGGTILGIHGVVGHAHLGIAEDAPGYQGLAVTDHEVATLTGACLAVRKEVFQRLGGFDEALGVAFNDVVLCLDALALGYRNLYVADPLLIHLESKTRGADDTPEKLAVFRREAEYARSRHPALFRDDPFYNPNLSIEHAYRLAWPPRVTKPWHDFARRSGDAANWSG